jgi:ATP-dependent helicase/nuclease subunit B
MSHLWDGSSGRMSRFFHLLSNERQVEEALAAGHAAATFGSFLARATASLPVRPATREVTRLATAIAFDEMGDERGWDAAHTLSVALDDALGSLRRAGIEADVLRRSNAPRARFLGRLLERTDEMLGARRVFDDRATGWLAARAIDLDAVGDPPSPVVIDGLFHYDPSQLAWIEALARRVSVTVRVPRRAPDAVLSTLENRWQSLERAPELELFELGVPDDVTMVDARTDGAEARAIAGQVLDALREGTPAEGVAIVLPELDESFLARLRAALEEARIPFQEPRGRPPIAAPAVQAALAWLELASGPLQRDVLVDLLRTRAVEPSPFVGGSTASARRRRALALASRLANVPVRTDRVGTLLSDVLAAEISNDSDESWMLESLARILEARDDLARNASRSQFVARLSAMWRALGLLDPSTSTVRAFVAADTSAIEAGLIATQLRDHAAGARALLDAASRVEEAAATLGLADAEVSAERFRSELGEALSSMAPSGIRRPGAVRVVRASEVARVATELLIVARASEGAFDAVLSDHVILDERIVASLPPLRRPLPPRELAAANRTELLAAIDGTRRLVVTRSETDANGRPLAAAALFSELAVGRAPRREPGSPLHSRAVPLSRRGAALVRLACGGDPDDTEIRRRVAMENDRLAFFLDPRKPATAWTGAIDVRDEGTREHLRDTFGGTSARPIAATAIERAAQCHFSAFAAGVLGASSADSIGEGLEPWQRGSLIHRALFLAFDAIRRRSAGLAPRGLAPVELAAVGIAAARKVLARETGSPLYRAEVERALRDVTAVVEWSLEEESDFRFVYGERSFGERRAPASRGADAPWPALVIGDGPSTVFVKGRIDRVDFSFDGSRARVIDYKTGALPAWKDVGTLVFQPPLYAFVVFLQMGRLSMPEVRALYLDTSKRPPRPLPAERSQVFSPEEMKAAEQRAARVVAQMWSGEVAPRPADAAICGRCEVRDICRRPAAMPVEEIEPDSDGAGA